MIEHVACLCCFFTTELLCHAIDDRSIIAFMSLHLIDFLMVEYVVVGFSCDLSWMCSLLHRFPSVVENVVAFYCLRLVQSSFDGRACRRFLLWIADQPVHPIQMYVSLMSLYLQCMVSTMWPRTARGKKSPRWVRHELLPPPFDTYLTPIWHPIALLHPSDIHLWLWAVVLIMEASWHVACHFDHRSARSRTSSHMCSTPCLPTICATVCLCWLCDRLCSFSLFSVSTHLRWNPLHLLDCFCYYIWCFVHVLEFVLEDVQHCTGSVRGM